jgi:hypothetical protein
MSKAQRDTALYRRGKYWLDWDRKADGSLRSPFLAVYWYDPGKRRTRSTSTRTEDVGQAKRELDAIYVKNDTGQIVCPTCGQIRHTATSYLVTEAIEAYLADNLEKSSYKALQSRLSVVLEYIATLPDPAIQATAIDANWIGKFRKWAERQQKVSVRGKRLGKRSLSTVETYVAQLAAAVNHAHKTRKILSSADFRPIPFKEVNKTPEYRSDIEELAAMFCYAQGYPALHRFLALSVATMARPDAVHDFNVDTQWKGRVIAMNPPDRRKTTKGRPTLPPARQIVPVLNASGGWFVGVKSVRRQWEKMAEFIGLPEQGEAGMKLIRRSMAKLVRDKLPAADWPEIEIFLGHRKFEEISALYAPDRPDYLAKARAGIEAIIEEIEAFVPLAYTGLAPEKEVARELEPC